VLNVYMLLQCERAVRVRSHRHECESRGSSKHEFVHISTAAVHIDTSSVRVTGELCVSRPDGVQSSLVAISRSLSGLQAPNATPLKDATPQVQSLRGNNRSHVVLIIMWIFFRSCV